MRKQLKGSNIDIININRTLYGYGDPDALNLTADQIFEIWEKALPKLSKKRGKIIITSTPIGINDCDFKNLWDNNNFKIFKMCKEQINHPDHYNQYPVEVITMMERIFGVDAVYHFCLLSAFKYRMRVGKKSLSIAEIQQDIDKEKWYLEMAEVLRKPKNQIRHGKSD